MADLCAELHTRTRTDHDRSDKLINLKLLVVATDKTLWSKMIANFYFIFKALEEELSCYNEFSGDYRNCLEQSRMLPNDPNACMFGMMLFVRLAYGNILQGATVLVTSRPTAEDHKRIWCLYIPELLRSKAFEEDLRYFFGDNWSSLVFPSPATEDFIQHIHDVAKENPIFLVAYCHSFYLALMAGGQIIKSMITKSLGLKNDLGTAAFQFKSKNAVQLKKQLKDSINGLGVDDEMKDKLIQEKILAYNMTNAIVKEIKLEPSSFAGIVKLLLLFLLIPLVLAYTMYYIYSYSL